jgi:hypothetical protein
MQIVNSTLVERFGDYRVSTGEVATAQGKARGYWVADINGTRVSEFIDEAQARARADVLSQSEPTRLERREKGAYL